MANTLVTVDKSTYDPGETVTVTVTSTNLAPAVPPTIVDRAAHVVREFSDGETQTVDEVWHLQSDPGSPAQTVVSTTVTDDHGNVYTQTGDDTFTTTAA